MNRDEMVRSQTLGAPDRARDEPIGRVGHPQ